MSDPVPMKNNKTSGNNKNTDLFIKGTKDTTYELKKGHDNIYIIKTDNKKLEFDRNSFVGTLKDLKKYSHNPIRTLDEEQGDSFGKIMNAIEMLNKTGKLYELINNDILSIYDDIKIVIPGTIAAYFIGCSSNDGFPGPVGCNPRCAAALAPGGKDPSEYTCNDIVLIYETDKTFSSLNQKISQHAYIFIRDPNFKGFTEDNIKQLTDAGITSATLIYGREDGTYENIVGPIPTNKLPLESQSQNQNQNATTNSNDNAAWILFIIIISIIIILLFIFLYQSYANRVPLTV